MRLIIETYQSTAGWYWTVIMIHPSGASRFTLGSCLFPLPSQRYAQQQGLEWMRGEMDFYSKLVCENN